MRVFCICKEWLIQENSLVRGLRWADITSQTKDSA